MGESAGAGGAGGGGWSRRQVDDSRLVFVDDLGDLRRSHSTGYLVNPQQQLENSHDKGGIGRDLLPGLATKIPRRAWAMSLRQRRPTSLRRCSWVRRMSCDTLVTPRASVVVPVSAHARCDTDRVSSAVFARDTRQTNVEIISLRLFNQADAAGA